MPPRKTVSSLSHIEDEIRSSRLGLIGKVMGLCRARWNSKTKTLLHDDYDSFAVKIFGGMLVLERANSKILNLRISSYFYHSDRCR